METDAAPEEILSGEYAYFSAYSDRWLHHARRYTEEMMEAHIRERGGRFVVAIPRLEVVG